MRTLVALPIVLLCHIQAEAQTRTPHRFKEIWGYLMHREEKYYPDDAPFTDIGYFSAKVNADGELVGGPTARPALTAVGERRLRVHLVVTTPWNNDLMHLLLSPQLPMRRRIIEGIVKRCAQFDGVQIDFESISRTDSANYLSFLKEVRGALPRDKIMSVAVMARWESWFTKYKNDPFDYAKIAPIADRVVVMSYDQHSRGSKPGPVASLPWCRKILTYAVKTVPAEKLIIGLPLYGRAWQDARLARSYRGKDADALVKEIGANVRKSALDGPSFQYEARVKVTVHFEDLLSLNAKLGYYAQHQLKGVAFWRISQEPDGTWSLMAPK